MFTSLEFLEKHLVVCFCLINKNVYSFSPNGILIKKAEVYSLPLLNNRYIADLINQHGVFVLYDYNNVPMCSRIYNEDSKRPLTDIASL